MFCPSWLVGPAQAVRKGDLPGSTWTGMGYETQWIVKVPRAGHSSATGHPGLLLWEHRSQEGRPYARQVGTECKILE